MIPPADAIAHPRTVVVHSDYASLALSAMVGSRWLYGLTVDACFEELLSDGFQLLQVHHHTHLEFLSAASTKMAIRVLLIICFTGY